MGETILKEDMEHSFDDPSKGIEGSLSQARGVNFGTCDLWPFKSAKTCQSNYFVAWRHFCSHYNP